MHNFSDFHHKFVNITIQSSLWSLYHNGALRRSTQSPRSGSNADLSRSLCLGHGQAGALIRIWHDCSVRAVLSLTRDHIDQDPTDLFLVPLWSARMFSERKTQDCFTFISDLSVYITILGTFNLCKKKKKKNLSCFRDIQVLFSTKTNVSLKGSQLDAFSP